MPRSNCQLFSGLRRKIGNALYHICYEAGNFEENFETLMPGGKLIHAPEVAVAIDNRRVAFFYHPNFGIVELLEGNV